MKTDGNHPAFESTVYHTKYSDSADRFPGLTKREYFAAMAMQGLMANPTFDDSFQETGRLCARMADALIAALNEEQQ